MKCFRSDNGGEYIASGLKELFSKSGIIHETTVPDNAEQNRLSERYNRTIVEKICSILFASGLTTGFWAEAAKTAVYIINLQSTASLKNSTLFESWFGVRPTLGHLRPFGCVAFSHVPKSHRVKLEKKSRKCILVGYAEHVKGYRLWDPAANRIFISRNVVFNEVMFKSPSSDRPDLIFDYPHPFPKLVTGFIPQDEPETFSDPRPSPKSTPPTPVLIPAIPASDPDPAPAPAVPAPIIDAPDNDDFPEPIAIPNPPNANLLPRRRRTEVELLQEQAEHYGSKDGKRETRPSARARGYPPTPLPAGPDLLPVPDNADIDVDDVVTNLTRALAASHEDEPRLSSSHGFP